MTREFTTKLLDLVEEGTLDAEYALRAALNYMSESSVEEMCGQMDLEEYFDDEEEENDYDDVDLVNIVWDTDGDEIEEGDTQIELPECLSISLVDEFLTSGDEYDEEEIKDWLAEKYGAEVITLIVKTD